MPADEELWEWCGEIRFEIQTCSFFSVTSTSKWFETPNKILLVFVNIKQALPL